MRAGVRFSFGARAWVATIAWLGASACGDGGAAHPDVKPGAPASASEGASGGATRVRRLTMSEYRAVVSDLLGEEVAASELFEDSLPTGYANGDITLTLQPEEALVLSQRASALADRAVNAHLDRLIGACDPSRDEAVCREAFFMGFVTRAFRRAPTSDERADLDALIDVGKKDGGFLGGLSTAVEAVLQDPAFLYRTELGAADDAPPGATITLTSDELASELSFFLTGTGPDDALLEAARAGRLRSVADLRREGERLLATPRATIALRTFAHAWLATKYVGELVKDRGVYPAFDAALAASMRADLDSTYDAVMVGSLEDAFTTRVTKTDARLAALYRIPFDGREQHGLGADRAGVLTRAGYLASHASIADSNPIARGVFLRGWLLCVPFGAPPAFVAAQTDFGSGTQLTTRQKYERHASDPACASCHDGIDGIGFGFERFDGIGARRDEEAGQPIDDSGVLLGVDPGGAFQGVPDLERRMLQGDALPRCFVRHVFRDAMGRAETHDDDETLAALSDFDVHTKIRELFLRVVTSRAFLERVKVGP